MAAIRRSAGPRVIVATALLASLAIATASAASAATPATTFSGKCRLTGAVFNPVATGTGQVGTNLIDGHGSCTGSLDGGASSAHAITGEVQTQGVYVNSTNQPVSASGIAFVAMDNGQVITAQISVLLGAAALRGTQGGVALGRLAGTRTTLTLSFATVSKLASPGS